MDEDDDDNFINKDNFIYNNSSTVKNNKSLRSSAPTSALTPKSKFISATQSLNIVLSPMEGLMNTTTQKLWSQVTSDFILCYWNSTTMEEWLTFDSAHNGNKQLLFADNLKVVSEVENQNMFAINSARWGVTADDATHQGLQITYRN